MRRSSGNRYASRKFWLAAWFTAFGTLGWLIGKMDGATYVWLATLVLAAYGAANVAEKRVEK